MFGSTESIALGLPVAAALIGNVLLYVVMDVERFELEDGRIARMAGILRTDALVLVAMLVAIDLIAGVLVLMWPSLPKADATFALVAYGPMVLVGESVFWSATYHFGAVAKRAAAKGD